MIKNGVATERIYSTEDGRLVREGHPDSARLAYAPGDPVSKADQGKLNGEDEESKSDEKPEDKAADKPADKSGSGLKINTSK